MDHSLPGSSVLGISQARTLEWAALSFWRRSSWPRSWTKVSCTDRWILYCWATREAQRNISFFHCPQFLTWLFDIQRILKTEILWQAHMVAKLGLNCFVCYSLSQSCSNFCNPKTVVHQAPLSMGFSRQEYWSGLPFPSPGGLPNPGIEPRSPAFQADFLLSEPPGKPRLFIYPTEKY